MMELMGSKGTEEEQKIPKNVRQIGEPGQSVKIFIEDYAYTYLHQLAQANLTCMKTAVLVGRAEGPECIYIQGALEIDMGQEQGKWFSNENWRDIFQMVQDWFEGQEVVGWFLSNPGFPAELTDSLRSLHDRHFPGDKYVFFQMDVLENEEVFYLRGDSGLAPACGYYIYYEKNDRMQAYMSQQKGGAGIEPEGILKDRAAVRFRNVMQEKKEQNEQKKMLAFLYTACTFLVMVILVIGVTMINNYDRMTNMESAIHRISESLGESSEERSEEGQSVEEAALEENRQALEAGVEEQEEESGEVASGEPEQEEQTAEEPESEEVQEVLSEAVREPETYQVREGDTLLGICRARYGNEEMVGEICELNGLEDGDKIYVGQTIVLP